MNRQVWLVRSGRSTVSGSGTAIPLLVSPSEQVEPTAVGVRLGKVWICPCRGPRVNRQVWLRGSEFSGVSGSGTATPLLVRPSEQVEPTGVASRLGKVWVCPCKGPRLNLHVWLVISEVAGTSRTVIPLLVRPSEHVEPT